MYKVIKKFVYCVFFIFSDVKLDTDTQVKHEVDKVGEGLYFKSGIEIKDNLIKDKLEDNAPSTR